MKVFLSLCLLFSLVSPVVLLTCIDCENEEETECTKNHTVKCMYSETSCRSVIVDGDLFPTPRAYYSCSHCEAGYYALNTGSSGSYNMFCCGSDNCNSQALEILSETMEPNGRECSGCYVEDERECSGTEVVKCLGDQTKCMKMMIFFLDVYSIRDYQIISARGCATPEMCEKFNVFENMMTTKSFPMNHSFECADAV